MKKATFEENMTRLEEIVSLLRQETGEEGSANGGSGM